MPAFLKNKWLWIGLALLIVLLVGFTMVRSAGAAKKAVSRRGKEPHKFRFARAPTRTDPRPPSKSNNNPPDLGPHPAPLHPSPSCAR